MNSSAIQRLNDATDPKVKQSLIEQIGILNESLQKYRFYIFSFNFRIESNLLAFDAQSQGYSPLSRSLFSPDVHVTYHDDNLTTLENADDKSIITPIPPQKKEKNNSVITSKLTPLLSGKLGCHSYETFRFS